MEANRVGSQPISICLLFLFVNLISSALVPEDEFKVSLYEAKDPIVQLSRDNFKEKIYDQPVAHLVEFYSSWCGHCVNFAPTWLEFSKQIADWNGVVKSAAINCGMDENMPTCRDFSVDSFPSLLYFNHMAKGPQHSKLIKDSHNTVEDIKQLLIAQLQRDQLMNGPKNWPRLKNVDSKSSLSDLWNLAELANANKLAVIIGKESDLILREVPLDLSGYQEIFVATLGTESEIAVAYQVQHAPALLLFDKSRKGLQFQSEATMTRLSIKNKIFEIFHVAGKLNEVVSDLSAPKTPPSGLVPAVYSALSNPYARDLVSGLHNMLTREIPQHKHMDQIHVRALKNFLKVLIMYFPYQIEETGLLRKDLEILYDWLLQQQEIQGEIWSAKVEKLPGIASMKLKDQTSRWVSCMGSDKKFRGYSCSLWLMFHTITVNYYLKPSSQTIEPAEILESIRDYIVDFFGCKICGEHFKTECESIRQEVKSKKDTIIWLWETHNRVNKRLSGDKHEDPQHPKIQFPSSNSCKLCHGPRGRLNRDKVLEFLVDHYSHFRLGDIYQPGRLLDINQEGTGEDKYWLLLSLSSIDLSLCFLLWAGSIAMVIFFCVYFKCWKNPASKKVVRYFLGNNKHFRYAR